MGLKRPVIIIVAILAIIAYVGLSIWFFGPGNGLSFIKSLSQQPTPTVTSKSGGFPLNQPIAGTAAASRPVPTSKPTPTPTPAPPTPTPTPLQGPGRYACDPNGICNDYSDEARKNCTKTFADRNCLGRCSDPSSRCTQ